MPTVEEIRACADALKEQQLIPTHARIRKALGGCGQNEITAAMKGYHAQSKPRVKGANERPFNNAKAAMASAKGNVILSEKRAAENGLSSRQLAIQVQAERNAERFRLEREGLVHDVPFPEIIRALVLRDSVFDEAI